jgi:hypothetical protein
MTNDFRYALEDEVRELERQTRIKEQEAAAARAAAPATAPSIQAPAASPDGAVPRELPAASTPETVPSTPPAELGTESHLSVQADSNSQHPHPAEAASVPEEKSPDDNAAV